MSSHVEIDHPRAETAPNAVPPVFTRTRSLPGGDAEQRRTDGAVKRAAAGDREALAYLYMRYSNAIYSYVRTIVRDPYAAEDVTQQVFVKLMTSLRRYDGRAGGFPSWVVRVARNAAIDSLREARPLAASESPELEGTHEPPSESHSESLRDALAGLTDGQRRVFVLRELVGLSACEVGDRLGKNEAAVHTLHHRARAAARKTLIEQEVAPATVNRRARKAVA